MSNRYDRNTRAAEAKRNDESTSADRRRAAYGALVTSATELFHAYGRRHEFGYWGELPTGQQVDLRSRAEKAAEDVFRAAADVELVGSEDAREAAAKLRHCASNTDDALMYGDQQDVIEPLASFGSSITAFIDTVRS